MISIWSQAIDKARVLKQQSWLFRWTIRMVVLLMVLGAGGLLVMVTGAVPVKASSGHWAITEAILQFAKQRSVSTHTLGITPPKLDDPALILKGAGHFEIGCRPCHGSPELHHPLITHRMVPHPPYLPQTAPNWQPEELFYMVKHGIKFTGMPAWPTQQRDDEVWAMVAFLQAFPRLDAKAYRQLVNGPPTPRHNPAPLSDLEPDLATDSVIKSCNPCHGANGEGRDVAAFPKLAGQRPEYLLASMRAYARGERHSGIMEPIVAGLSNDQLLAIARRYANMKSNQTGAQRDAESIQRGSEIARKGIPKQEIPACVDCHSSGEFTMNPIFPSLDGQFGDYINLQLTLFKENRRGGTSHQHIMATIAKELTKEQMSDVARYFASLKGRAPSAQGNK